MSQNYALLRLFFVSRKAPLKFIVPAEPPGVLKQRRCWVRPVVMTRTSVRSEHDPVSRAALYVLSLHLLRAVLLLRHFTD